MEAVERDDMSMETDLQSEDYVDLFDLNKLK